MSRSYLNYTTCTLLHILCKSHAPVTRLYDVPFIVLLCQAGLSDILPAYTGTAVLLRDTIKWTAVSRSLLERLTLELRNLTVIVVVET